MAQEYEITGFKVGDFKDQNGNTWCDMALAGEGEPIKIVVKDPSKFGVGMKLYGQIKEMTSKAGKTYLRFYREKPENSAQGSTYDSNGAKHGNALKIAADFYLTKGIAEMDENDFVDAVSTLAQRLFSIPLPTESTGSTAIDKNFQGSTAIDLDRDGIPF